MKESSPFYMHALLFSSAPFSCSFTHLPLRVKQEAPLFLERSWELWTCPETFDPFSVRVLLAHTAGMISFLLCLSLSWRQLIDFSRFFLLSD